jgi:hypothetical protein
LRIEAPYINSAALQKHIARLQVTVHNAQVVQVLDALQRV